MDQSHVLVVGGGVGGLVAALWLRYYGYETTVIEQKARYLESNSAGGLHLGYNATRCLRAIGVHVPEIATVGNVMTVKRYSDGLTLSEVRKKMEHSFMHRIDLIELLTRHAKERGVVISAGESLQSIQEDSDSITAKLQGGKLLKASLLIGADGINSKVRALIPATAGVGPRLTESCVFLVDVSKDAMDKHAASREIYATGVDPFHFWMGPERCIVAWTMPHRKNYHLQFNDFTYGNGRNYEEHDDDSNPLVTHFDNMPAFRRRWDDFEEGIRAICQEAEFCTKWRIAELPELPSWGSESGRVMLLGDAAHAFEPFAGQGAAMAVEDATVLSTLFHKSRSTTTSLPAVLKAYEQIRRPRVETMRQIAKSNVATFALPDGKQQQERDSHIGMKQSGALEWSSEKRYEWMDEYDALGKAQNFQHKEGTDFTGTGKNGSWT